MVFKSAQNWVCVSDGSCMIGGSVFHTVGPETAKLLRRHLVVLEQGTASKLTMCCRTEMTDLDRQSFRHWVHTSGRLAAAAWCKQAQVCRPVHTRTHTHLPANGQPVQLIAAQRWWRPTSALAVWFRATACFGPEVGRRQISNTGKTFSEYHNSDNDSKFCQSDYYSFETRSRAIQ